MNILIITSSPNTDGLTAACGNAAKVGVEMGDATAKIISLNKLNIPSCHACGSGWGTCLKKHVCQVKDDFQELHKEMSKADGYIIITPTYWGDMSESLKSFIDRIRRCEASNGEENNLFGKPFICVAAPGGTGNGCLSTLSSFERFVDHVKGIKYDFIGVTRRNSDYKLVTIKYAAICMVQSLTE